MRRLLARRAFVFACAGALVAGCDNSTGNKEPSVTITTSGTTATVGQGLSTTLSVFVARTNFDKTVNLTVEGAPAGITAIVTPGNVDNATPSSTLLISAAPSAEPGTSTITVRAKGDGITDQTINVGVTVTVTGTFTLAVSDATVTVAQGGGGVNTVLVNRAGNNGSNVTLAAAGLPTGVTATFTSSPTTTASATLNLAATAGVVPGTYTVVVTGSATGLSNQPTSFSLVVIPPSATANVSIPFCADGMPAWFAFRNEGFNWQQVVATGTAFNFAATQKLQVAYAYTSSTSSQVNVFSVTRAEFSASTDRDCGGPKAFTGSVAGLAAGQAYEVVMGSSTATGTSFAPTFSLTAVNARPLDLMATRGTASGEFLAPDMMILRRNLNLTTGAAIPTVDFSAPEAFAPAASNLTIQGLLAGDDIEMHNTLWTATSTFGTAHSALLTGGSTTLYSAPAAQLIAGDLHELFLDASQSTPSLITGRSYVEYFGAPADRTASLGPNVGTPTISTIAPAPYARMRGQITSQPEYNTFADFAFIQSPAGGGQRTIVVGQSAGYLGGAPATWDVSIPDFSGTAGFNATWMPTPNQTVIYVVETYSGRTELLFGALPALSDIVRIGYRAAITTSIQLAQFRSAQRAPGRRLPQYLRR